MCFGIERTEMTVISINTPVQIAAPRGAAIAAVWFVAFLDWMERLADRRTQSRQFTARVEEASRVRSQAQQLVAYDPRFAADLFAAADRHERD